MYLIRILASLLLSTLGTAQQSPFDPREATIAAVHSALFARLTTCRDVVSSFIARIERFNPLVNAIIALNPEALGIADSLDDALAKGNATGPLFCVPILLKDNYDALPLPTTGGSLALNGSTPTEDAPSVIALRRAGAVILGKTNLHELALEGLSVSSLGGQTINPYDSTRTPGGSSGGTGAAVAASFAVFGTGTDTVNSLRSPASANSLFSFRPTRGLISRAGIIPISYTQDTIGAIGRSLPDIATALTVMASIGYDPRDNATAAIPSSAIGIDYTSSLSPARITPLKNLRIGILQGFFNTSSTNETYPVNAAMSTVSHLLTTSGATLINLTDRSTYNATALIANLDVQQLEYRESLCSYLSSRSLSGPRPSSMPDLYLNTSNFLVIPSQYTYVQTALHSSTSNASYFTKQSDIANLTTAFHSLFSLHGLDAIIYPEQKNLVVPLGSPSQAGRNGILAALTGSPVITMPIGFSPNSETAPIGIPIGMEILGLPWTEEKLLGIAKGIDDRLHARRMPVGGGLEESVEVEGVYGEVPVVRPERNGDGEKYPLGVLGWVMGKGEV
jgi:Asp-tRNA(Asn)/Glu-tRNA(Gln) amidotransferase A subunit family amidase